jgi:uncharacterized membrane protein
MCSPFFYLCINGLTIVHFSIKSLAMEKMMYVLSLVFALVTVSAAVNNVQAQTKTKTVTSHKKKNALIGAGVGAATGAVVSHKHAKGAVVGGAVGAGAGYLWGRHRDKTHPMRKTITKKKD